MVKQSRLPLTPSELSTTDGALINLGGGNTILLEGVNSDSLTAANFAVVEFFKIVTITKNKGSWHTYGSIEIRQITLGSTVTDNIATPST